MNKMKFVDCSVSDVKVDSETGTFTCYANTKGIVDKALDKSMDGYCKDSIAYHKAEGTMPKMFWMHKSDEMPVGQWLSMEEDAKGLKMTGRLLPTTMGKDIEILAKAGELSGFSIGYIKLDEEWNSKGGYNELRKVHITEVSWTAPNKECNPNSTLISIKSHMEDGELPTKRELQSFLRESGLSKRQAEKIANKYTPEHQLEVDVFEEMCKTDDEVDVFEEMCKTDDENVFDLMAKV